MDLTALQSELTTDPAGKGYAQHVTAGSDQQLADELNKPQAGITNPQAVKFCK